MALADADLFPVQQGSTVYKITAEDLKVYTQQGINLDSVDASKLDWSNLQPLPSS